MVGTILRKEWNLGKGSWLPFHSDTENWLWFWAKRNKHEEHVSGDPKLLYFTSSSFYGRIFQVSRLQEHHQSYLKNLWNISWINNKNPKDVNKLDLETLWYQPTMLKNLPKRLKLCMELESPPIWATSHTRLRACDHYTSSDLIGGKGGAGPISLHTTLEGPTEYINARWM